MSLGSLPGRMATTLRAANGDGVTSRTALMFTLVPTAPAFSSLAGDVNSFDMAPAPTNRRGPPKAGSSTNTLGRNT